MKCEFKLCNSLEKIFFDMPADLEECHFGSMLKNEVYSFQLVCKVQGDAYQPKVKCKVEVESELEPYIQINQVGYVPSTFPAYLEDDEDYLTKQPGLFPDPLYKIKNGEMELASNQTRALWIVVEPKGEKIGKYPISIKISDMQGNVLANNVFEIEIIDADLPEMDICNTAWFHGDCIAKLHNVEILSDEYFSIVEKYLEVYTKYGHNMILTPVFTPPLDTEIGGERPTNQLVEVVCNAGVYTFKFDYLKKWLDLCSKWGIKYFEISHLFTQWGAHHAPKIMATVDGKYKKIFGWETDALSDEYKKFLKIFLPELIEFLQEEGVMQKCYFHVSDEPAEKDEIAYRSAKEILKAHISEEQMIDALSSWSFYEKGITQKPIVANDYIHHFLENNIKGLWTYYCTCQGKNVANRFMAMPSYRNRILGWQLYKYDICGFLQWGFNFWFSQLSKEVINPYVDTTAGGAYQSGDAFVVYPLSKDGEVVCSLRLYVFLEGMQDMRALKLLESLTDKAEVMSVLGEIQGFDIYPRNNSYIIELREKINDKIKEKIYEKGEK